MSVLTQIRNWFNLGTEETEDVGLDALTDELSQREEVLNLSAVYQDGQINRTGETTAVFPILVYNDDEYYTTTSKEFPLPRDGLDETDSNLTAFLASSCGIPREEVGVEHIRQIGGRNADARLNFMGNIRVYDPVPEENGAEVDFDQGVDDNDGENIAEAPDEDPRDENETDPTPDEVAESENLADVNGIGPQRAEWLRGEGYETPADLYYATDENLEAVHGFGPKSVGHIRDDIGGVDMDESDAGNSEEQNDDTGESSSEEETDPTSDTEGKTGGDSEEDVSEDETATTRNVEDEPTAEENDTENDT